MILLLLAMFCFGWQGALLYIAGTAPPQANVRVGILPLIVGIVLLLLSFLF